MWYPEDGEVRNTSNFHYAVINDKVSRFKESKLKYLQGLDQCANDEIL